ncbi:MAG: hypothetical protein U0228_26215 [Myxococcaceae bacterium]
MSRTVVVGLVLFIAGVIAGRASVLSGGPAPSSSLPTSVSAPIGPSVPAPSSPSGPEVRPGGTLTGQVAEVLQVPQYTYLRFESGEWAAIDSAPQVQAGQQVTLHLQNEMQEFTSPSLGRTFARLWFATLDGAPPVEKSGPPAKDLGAAPMAPPSDPSVKGAIAAVAGRAATPMRVADVYTERALLKGTRVKVTGKVDRVNVVQGLHYVHLKDGSGAAADKTDDLLCISSDDVPAGQTVSLEGVVAVDKNVGMGTNPVVLDEARLAQ